MKRAKKCNFLLSFITLFAVFLVTVQVAHAGPFEYKDARVGQGTATLVNIAGIPGENFDISYVDASGVTHSKIVTTVRPTHSTIGVSSYILSVPAGTSVDIKNLTQPQEPTKTFIASRFEPGRETAETMLAMNSGSTLTAFGQTFTLGGAFMTIATTTDYDIASPGYGTLGGYIPSSLFNVFATRGGDQIVLQMNGGISPFSVNVASIWGADMPDTGISASFTQALVGSLTYQGVTNPFTGSITGFTTFLSDNFETIAGSIVLDGIGTGVFSASGLTIMNPVPVPSTAWLLISGIGVLVAGSRKSNG